MYEKGKVVVLCDTVGLMSKNLQVVSFDSAWHEIYIGTVRRDRFIAVCPNQVDTASQIDFCWNNGFAAEAGVPSNAYITCAKWCPLENCTVLVLGSQFGIQLYDWDGSTLICNYNFVENGIGIDERQVTGAMAKGIAALGSSFIAVGIHTGTILLFEVTSDAKNFVCTLSDTQRGHVHSTTDLASTTTVADETKEILVSGDESGLINIWTLKDKGLKLLRSIEPFGEFPVTCISLWNKIWHGIIIAGYGSGHIRIFSIFEGCIVAEACAHGGWITGMDLASQSGQLITASEDGFVKIWQLSAKGHIISHRYSSPIPDTFLVGAKFLDPKGAAFALASYDSNKIQIYVM